MEFLNCSYGEEFYQSLLKHVTCSSVHTRLSGGNADTPEKCIAVCWCCGGGGFYLLCSPSLGPALVRLLWPSVTSGDNWSLGAEEGKS